MVIKFQGKRFFRATSCGVAIQKTHSKAVIHAILELVERDAALLAWFGNKNIPLIDITKIKNKKLLKLIKNIEFENRGIKTFLITTDIKIPTVFTIVFDRNDHYPLATFGLAAGINLEKTIIKSIEEALMILNTVELFGNSERKIEKKDIKNLIDHILFYSLPENKFVLKRFLNYNKYISIETIHKQYNFIKIVSAKDLINYLIKKKIELIAFDFSDPFLSKNDLYMTRIIAPNLCPMFVGGIVPSVIARLIKKRLKMPLSRKLNINPHPFG
ncbi:MAG: YcaO-like family protein [Candidatus Omnitrophota bacterium]